MTKWLIHTFVKNYANVHDENVRFSYGVLSTVVGMICNVLLFAIKGTCGLLVHSVSIISDGFNNLSDSLSCLITLVGFKVAKKPADEEHPFGHGRMEYIVSFISCIIIFIVIYELLSQSINKILHPEKVIFDDVLFVILIASILIKVWMAKFYETLGNATGNLAMKASSQDARNDVLATIVSLLAMLLSCAYPDIPFDGIGGTVLSFFLFFSAYGMAKEIVGALLGNPIDSTLAKKVENEITQNQNVIGVHDLLIHDYGPSVKYGSAHVEIDANMDLRKAHSIVDEAERRILGNEKINMTLHIDPVEKDSERSSLCKKILNETLKELDPDLSMHDFRMVQGKKHINLIFDVMVPYTCRYAHTEITDAMIEAMKQVDFETHIHVTYDHGYIEKGETDEEV